MRNITYISINNLFCYLRLRRTPDPVLIFILHFLDELHKGSMMPMTLLRRRFVYDITLATLCPTGLSNCILSVLIDWSTTRKRLGFEVFVPHVASQYRGTFGSVLPRDFVDRSSHEFQQFSGMCRSSSNSSSGS